MPAGTAQIKEAFWSIQGEGARHGVPSVFVRFGGCNLRCAFCDTDFLNGLTTYTVDTLVAEVQRLAGPTRSLIVTGGEPLLYQPFLASFLGALKRADSAWYIAVETNGTQALQPDCGLLIDWVCCSPKDLAALALTHADEVKVVFTHDFRRWITEAPHHITADYYYVSPEAYHANPYSVRASARPGHYLEEVRQPIHDVLAFIQEHPQWRLNLQLHKILALP